MKLNKKLTIEIKNNKVSDAKDSVSDAKVKISEYLNEKKPSKVISEIKMLLLMLNELYPIEIVKEKK